MILVSTKTLNLGKSLGSSIVGGFILWFITNVVWMFVVLDGLGAVHCFAVSLLLMSPITYLVGRCCRTSGLSVKLVCVILVVVPFVYGFYSIFPGPWEFSMVWNAVILLTPIITLIVSMFRQPTLH